LKAPKQCPCWSGAGYDACCAPYHRGEREAPDPVRLMRSRYAAFALGEAEYLLHTLHKDHEDHGMPRGELLRMLRGSKEKRRYTSLRILDERRSGRTAEVLFCAGVTEAGKDVSFVELSDFEHHGTGWRYLSGILVAVLDLKRDVDGLGIDEFLALAAR
jgi:SEC-C motif-containing protein